MFPIIVIIGISDATLVGFKTFQMALNTNEIIWVFNRQRPQRETIEDGESRSVNTDA